MKKFISHCVTAVAALSSVATLITFTSGWTANDNSAPWLPYVLGAVVVLLSVAYAVFQTWQKKKLQLSVSADLKLTLQQADLFAQKGIIVIGFNEYFDTHVGDGVVSSSTIHGKFINRYFKDRLDELNAKIDDSLKRQGIEGNPNCVRRNQYGRTTKYPLGTCACVRDGENTYVLVALTHFNEKDVANIDRHEYYDVMCKLMRFIGGICESKEVHMPILGTGLARMNRTNKRILHYMIDTLDFIHPCLIPGGLFIDIYSLSDSEISLNEIEEVFNNGIKENV